MKRHRVYVAGPMSPEKSGGEGAIEFLSNLRRGIQLSANLIVAGYAPFSPFIDFQFFLHTPISEAEIREVSLSFLEVCEAVIVISPWGHSVGTRRELEEAGKRGLPIFDTISELDWYFGTMRYPIHDISEKWR